MWRSWTSLIELPTSTSTTQTCWTYKVLKSTKTWISFSLERLGLFCSCSGVLWTSKELMSPFWSTWDLLICWSASTVIISYDTIRQAGSQREYSSVCFLVIFLMISSRADRKWHVVIPVSSRNFCAVRKPHFLLFLLFKCRKQSGISLESRRADYIWTAVVW